MATQTVTLKIDEELATKMVEFYQYSQVENTGEYVFFHAVTIDKVSITIYSSSRGYKALFSGEFSLKEAQIWDENAEINIPKEKVKTEWLDSSSQIGSDEVGTGDFFGPIIVVAAYTSKDTIKLLK